MKNLHQTLYCIFFLLNASCTGPVSQHNEKRDTSKALADTLKTSVDKTKKHAKEWQANPQASKINFTIKNFGSDVHGSLGGLKASIHFDENDLKHSSFDASVKVSTINTNNSKRDKDLMNEKYFDEPNHTEVIFRSDEITKSVKGYTVAGHFIIKGKTLAQQIPLSFEHKDNSGIFKSQFTLKRLDYNIGGSGPIMGKDVNVNIEVVALQK